MSKLKVRKDFDKNQPITVNVSGCSYEEKIKVQQAFFDIGIGWSGQRSIPQYLHASTYGTTFEFLSEEGDAALLFYGREPHSSAITPEQFFAMVYEDEPQGHPHAELMMAYAEDAKKHEAPWKLWQIRGYEEYPEKWLGAYSHPQWDTNMEYRRKPKTHTVHGVEVPDLRFEPKRGDRYYLADPTEPEFTRNYLSTSDNCDTVWTSRRLCYENTEVGKQAARMHAKAMLGIA